MCVSRIRYLKAYPKELYPKVFCQKRKIAQQIAAHACILYTAGGVASPLPVSIIATLATGEQLHLSCFCPHQIPKTAVFAPCPIVVYSGVVMGLDTLLHVGADLWLVFHISTHGTRQVKGSRSRAPRHNREPRKASLVWP